MIDWPPNKAVIAELIVWPAEPVDFGIYLQAALHGIEMPGTLVDGLLRFVNSDCL
jgi:hypothetical protein